MVVVPVVVVRIIICIHNFREIIYRQRATTSPPYVFSIYLYLRGSTITFCIRLCRCFTEWKYMDEIAIRFRFWPFVKPTLDEPTCIIHTMPILQFCENCDESVADRQLCEGNYENEAITASLNAISSIFFFNYSVSSSYDRRMN